MVVERKGERVHIALPRRCEGGFSRKLYTTLEGDQYSDAKEFVFEFRDTEFIDSSTIGILVTINRKCSSSGVSMLLRNLNSDILELFTETGLSSVFTVENDDRVDEASVDLFIENLDVRLEIEKEIIEEVCVFHLSGMFNYPVGSNYFKQQLLLAAADYKKILLDFEHLTFFDSLSVSVVLSMFRLMDRTGGSLRFCKANYMVRDLFESLKIDQVIPLFETVDAALKEW